MGEMRQMEDWEMGGDGGEWGNVAKADGSVSLRRRVDRTLPELRTT